MPSNEKIPFLDLVTPHRELEAELVAVFQKALRTAGFVGGPMVEEFERAFADFCDLAFSSACLIRSMSSSLLEPGHDFQRQNIQWFVKEMQRQQ